MSSHFNYNSVNSNSSLTVGRAICQLFVLARVVCTFYGWLMVMSLSRRAGITTCENIELYRSCTNWEYYYKMFMLFIHCLWIYLTSKCCLGVKESLHSKVYPGLLYGSFSQLNSFAAQYCRHVHAPAVKIT